MSEADLNLGNHISRRFNADLDDVRQRVLAMGGLVEQQVREALQALVDGDGELGDKVAGRDYKVNEFEVAIDEECSRIIALRQPAASDLRLLVAVIKTITDLERIGDEAEKVARMASKLAVGAPPAAAMSQIQPMGAMVRDMVTRALNALARMDTDAAMRVVEDDEKVDSAYEAMQRTCITHMMEDPRSIQRVLNLMWVARALERIGDHASNISEYVIYLVLGKDIRHTTDNGPVSKAG